MIMQKFESEERKMLKKIIGAKGFLLFGLMIVMLLSGCGSSMTEQDNAGVVNPDTESSDSREAEISQPITTDHSSETEAAEPAREEISDTLNSDMQTPVQNETKTQPQAKSPIELTDQGKTFLAQMCKELNDFNAQTTMDEKFYRDFLFNSYTGASSESTETVYRENLGFEETVVKVSLQEAESHTKLVFGTELPDIKPSFKDMEEGQTSFYYQDGSYYIGVSDFPDYQYTFLEIRADEKSDTDMIVKFNIDFEGESNVGEVSFTISPENNENGFVIRSKTTEFFK